MRQVIAIGGSVGATAALETILRGLPRDLPAAVVVVIHIPRNFPPFLADRLAPTTNLPVKDAEDGEALSNGVVYVATPDRHLVVDDGRLRLSDGPRENRSRPCVDVLFRSIAVSYGPRAVGVVLSGALDDGTAGLWAIKDRGGVAIVQSPEEAEVKSMPLSAAAQVEVDYVRPAAEIAELLTKVVSVSAPAPLRANKQMESENAVALRSDGGATEVFKMGTISPNTCPECHGIFVKIEEGNILRYRCHTGHGFSSQTLFDDASDAIERSLYSAIRAIKERSFLLREMERQARERGDSARASEFATAAARDEATAEQVVAFVPTGSKGREQPKLKSLGRP